MVKNQNPDVQITHCVLYHEALIAKAMPPDLTLALEQAVKIVNFIKSQPLKSWLFTIGLLWNEMGSEHQSLLLHAEVRWLSRGKVLSHVYELKLRQFSSEHDIPHKEQINDDSWWAKIV